MNLWCENYAPGKIVNVVFCFCFLIEEVNNAVKDVAQFTFFAQYCSRNRVKMVIMITNEQLE